MAPSDLSTLREEAQAFEEDERYEDALAIYERILQVSLDDQNALERKVHVLVSLRRDEEALVAIDTVLTAYDDDSTTAWLLRHKSRVLWLLNRYDAAQEAVESALRLEPDHIYALLTKCFIERDLGHLEASLAAAQRLVELEPEDYQAVLEHAGALYRLKRYEEAIPVYERAAELDPAKAAPVYWKGRSLTTLGRHEEALIAYEQTVAVSPNYAYGWRVLSGTLAQLGRYEQALAACDRALQLNDNLEYWNLKVSLLKLAKRTSEAVSTLDEVIERTPNDGTPVHDKAYLLYELKRYGDALETIDEGLSRLPGDIALLKLKGSTLTALERYDDALAAWQHVLKLDPDEAMTLRNMLSTYAWQKRYGDMFLPTNRLLARDERDGKAWAGRIQALYSLGQFEEAQAAGIEAMRLSPDDANVKAWAETADSAFHRPGSADSAFHRPGRGGNITLHDGRRMEYAEYGAPDGQPILCCHSTPGSRFEYASDDALAKELGIRLIVPDRPGYGLSDSMRKPTLLGWVDDAEELLDSLGLQQFAVIGVSGGGPYAAACAFKRPERVTSLTLACSPAPIALHKLWRRLGWQPRIAGIAIRVIPWPLYRAVGKLPAEGIRSNPDRLLRLQERVIHGAEKAQQLRVYTPIELETAAEPYRRSGVGQSWDSRLISRAWGFDVKGITVPTYVWQGEEDRLVPPIAGRFFAQNIHNCHATFYPGEGHSFLYKHAREIFGALPQTDAAVPLVASQAVLG